MQTYCQSCAMLFGNTQEFYGTNGDGSKNHDYCGYCLTEGKFTSNLSMQQMIQRTLPYMQELHPHLSTHQLELLLHENFPKLKRWQSPS